MVELLEPQYVSNYTYLQLIGQGIQIGMFSTTVVAFSGFVIAKIIKIGLGKVG